MPFLPPEALADEESIATASARAIALAKNGDTRAALNLALQARRRAQGLDTGRGEIEALNAAAMVHMIRGDSIAAVAAAIDACELARRSGDRVLHGQAMVSLKMSAFNLGACDDVLGDLQGCTREALALGEVGMEIRARTALGVVYGDAGRFAAAACEFARAMALAEAHTNPTGRARIGANMANLDRKRAVASFVAGFEARGLRECADAIRLAELACLLSTQEGNVSVEIDALAIRGCAEFLRGHGDLAVVLLRESIALGNQARCPSAIVWVLCELGRLHLARDELDGAYVAFAEAHDIARELRPSRKIALAASGLADVAARRGDVAAAREWRQAAADEAADFAIASLQTRRQLREIGQLHWGQTP